VLDSAPAQLSLIESWFAQAADLTAPCDVTPPSFLN